MLERNLVEATQVFTFSWATALTFVILLMLLLILISPVRRRVAKIITIEVSVGGSRDIASAYLETLSSKGLIVEEAIAVKNGEAIILAGEGKVLPHVEKAVDHAVLFRPPLLFSLGGQGSG